MFYGELAVNDRTNLDILKPFIGSWKGTGKGWGSGSEVEHVYKYILQQKIVQERSLAVIREEDGDLKEIHEDMGVFS